MNKNTAKDYLPLVQALADGKVIQHKGSIGWYDLDQVYFDQSADNYRIKPDPREIWVNHYVDRTWADYGPYDSKDSAREAARPGARQVRYREVIE